MSNQSPVAGNQQHTQTLKSELTGGQGGKVRMTQSRSKSQHKSSELISTSQLLGALKKKASNINVKQFSPQTRAAR